ncbi:MAG TPA: tRNA 2-selenouridine(34) synthase MnmH, partial [Verrucomicrobiae bacterium]|nr:tRNA 2-selenouridine(34) synthase MnmH [Verrucomicrobiae bacterium]
MLAEGDFRTFARILLEEYYDPLYGYPNQPDADYYQSISMEQPLEAVQRIAHLLDSLEEESAD